MNNKFKDILSVGFDIDQTMYPINPEIDEIIQIKFAEKILERNSGLKDIIAAREYSERRYSETGSRSIVLKEAGYANPDEIFEILHNCLANANLIRLIKRDNKLQDILEKIKQKYELFLITNNPEDIALLKLNKLGIDENFFKIKCYGDTVRGMKKSDGSLFRYFLEKSHYEPSQHLYIGDNHKADIIPAKNLGMKTISVGKKISEADFSIRKIYGIEKLLL